jgi:hypothetical protein
MTLANYLVSPSGATYSMVRSSSNIESDRVSCCVLEPLGHLVVLGDVDHDAAREHAIAQVDDIATAVNDQDSALVALEDATLRAAAQGPVLHHRFTFAFLDAGTANGSGRHGVVIRRASFPWK